MFGSGRHLLQEIVTSFIKAQVSLPVTVLKTSDSCEVPRTADSADHEVR